MSGYLKKSIAIVLAAISMGVSSNAAASTTTLEGVSAVGYSWEDYGPYYWSIDDYYNVWDNHYMGAGGSGGGGGADLISCDFLKMMKPDACPNPIPYPTGHDYGRDLLPGGGLDWPKLSTSLIFIT